jgi:DnaJ-class molecular chaperone
MRDPYAVLGVGRDATKEQIKQAYRKLARLLHPDRDPGNAAAEDRFKEVTVAYDILSDAGKRIRYDRGEIDAGGSEVRRRPTAGRRPEGAKAAEAGAQRARHPFERFFRQRGGGMPGADVNYGLTIEAEAAAKGTVERLTLTSGKHVDVKIPAGTRDGQVLRLKGQGMPGLGGGEAGSARVEIRVKPAAAAPLPSGFRQEGFDLHADVPISLPEAVLGGRIEVDTLDGPVTVAVPEGANSGTVLRLKGKGAVRPDASRGDHLARLTVMLPAKPDKDLTGFVRRWAERNAYEVRRKTSKV